MKQQAQQELFEATAQPEPLLREATCEAYLAQVRAAKDEKEHVYEELAWRLLV